MRKALSDWESIIQTQINSGLKAASYCRQNDINYKTFCSRKHALKQKGIIFREQSKTLSDNEFIQAKVIPAIFASRDHTTQQDDAPLITLEVGPAKLHLKQSTDPLWVAALLRSLAS